MKDEKMSHANEWLNYAKDDLESAEIILKKTDNYHIAVYHSHQAIEKMFKWFLLKNNRKFPFVHDLKVLLKNVNEIANLNGLIDDILYIDDLYPQLRYPTGEKVTKEEAEKCLAIANKIYKALKIKG